MPAPVLTLAHLRKDFGGTRALADASLSLYAGEVTALLGENGAGKSTLVKVLAGLHQPDAGEIRLDGRRVRLESAAAARRLGISVIHQESALFDNLSVAENILIDALPKRRGLIAWRELRRRSRILLDSLEASFDPDQLVGELSIAQKHLVQIARGLNHAARIMVMDEPTAALSHSEAEHLRLIVQRLKAGGTAVLFITHRLEEIAAIADRYTVFRDGSAVGEGMVDGTTAEELLGLMVGRAPEAVASAEMPAPRAIFGSEALRIEHLSRKNEFHDVSFEVRRGEILGVYGLVGAGRSELMQCLFGLTRSDTGSVLVAGIQQDVRNPEHAIRLGLAYLPEDRQREGVIAQFSIAANIALANLVALSPFGFHRSARATQLATRWMMDLQIKATDADQLVEDLSGGNQQKVVLAKWLATQPNVLILDEPTKGIDAGAKAAVHRVVRELASQGLAIVLVSSELPEVLGMSDRVIVMRHGHLCAQFARAEASAERLARAATGT
jgi:rhamnose transport system ATP-binding protein